MMPSEGGAFGRGSGHEDRTLISGIHALIKEAPGHSLVLSDV